MKFSDLIRLGLMLSLLSSSSVFAQSNVQALADRWAAAYNRHDRAVLGAVYTQSARLMMHGSPTIGGRGDIQQYWARDFEDRDPLTILTVTHSVQGSDMTLVHGNYRVINRNSGAQLGAGRFAHVWMLAASGEWYLDRDLWSEAFEPYEPSESANDIQWLAERWTQAYNKHDRAALAALYEDGAALMMHGAPTISGRSDIGAFWAEDFTEDNPLTLLSVTHAVEGVDMILVHGNYEVIGRADGARLGFGRFAHIWTLGRDGEWRLDRDLWRQRSEPAP